MRHNIKELMRLLWELLLSICSKKVFLFVEPRHPNLGDLAQLMCTRTWIAKVFPQYKLIEYGSFFLPFDNDLKSHFYNFPIIKMVLLKLFVRRNDIFIGHSGYFFVDHHAGWFAYELLLKTFPYQRFIILPQTINFYTPVILQRVQKSFSNHQNLTLLCRDEVSYENAQNLFKGIHLLLFPDIVTSLIGTKRYNHKRSGVLFCMRDDVEAYYSVSDIAAFMSRLGDIRKERVDTTIKLTQKKIEKEIGLYIEEMIEKISSFQVVVTDRYHGTIFSAIASTPVVVINSADHKLSSGVNWFPREIFGEMVQYASNLDEAWDMVQQVLRCPKMRINNPPYFKERYWDCFGVNEL